MDVSKRREGPKRSHLSPGGEGLLNPRDGWRRSAAFKAVNKMLEKEIRKCLLVTVVGTEMQAAPRQSVLVGSRR